MVGVGRLVRPGVAGLGGSSQEAWGIACFWYSLLLARGAAAVACPFFSGGHNSICLFAHSLLWASPDCLTAAPASSLLQQKTGTCHALVFIQWSTSDERASSLDHNAGSGNPPHAPVRRTAISAISPAAVQLEQCTSRPVAQCRRHCHCMCATQS